jgi:phytoene dehydrogenase-like protein
VSWDAIVIGAGANGLVAAHTLARAGHRVLVLERQTADDDAPDEGWVPAPLVARLGLGGVRFRRPDPWLEVALEGGGSLALYGDVARSAEAIRRLSPRDAERWPEFCARMRRLAHVLELLYLRPPPDVETTDWGELLRLAGLGWRVRRLGRATLIDLLRILPMSVADLLDEWFTSDPLKGGLAAGGVRHLRQGPRSGGTAFNFLHHHVGNPPGVFRPARSNLREILARMPGIEVRRDAAVRRVDVTGGRATGVTLAGGEALQAARVLSSADPRATLLGLVDAAWLDPELVRAVRHIKCRGVAAHVTLRIAGDPGFTSLAVAPSPAALERAYDDVKYGRVSREPLLEATSDGEGRLDVHVQYVPYALADGDWDEAKRRALGETVVARLDAQAPGLRSRVTDVAVRTPPDFEARDGLTEGHRYQGELTLDQILFMRPVPGWSRYRTPVSGLYLCGAGCHPGGAVPGAAGWLAANQVLRGAR